MADDGVLIRFAPHRSIQSTSSRCRRWDSESSVKPRVNMAWCACGWTSHPKDPRNHEEQAIAHVENSSIGEPARPLRSMWQARPVGLRP